MNMYARISQHLQKQIRLGALPPGSLLPREVDLAAQLGVSRKTLRSALAELESAGLLTRKKRTGTMVCADARERVTLPLQVGIVIALEGAPEPSHDFLRQLQPQHGNELNVLMRCLQQNNVRMLLLPARPTPEWHSLDAVVIANVSDTPEAARYLAEHKIAHVTLESRLEVPGLCTVMGDDEEATRICTRELLEAGHRQIAFVGGNLNRSPIPNGFRRRTEAFLQTCRDFGVTPPAQAIFNVGPMDKSAYQYDTLLQDYGGRTRGCTAVVAAIGHSLWELEKWRRVAGPTAVPELEVRCVDLHPFNAGPDVLAFLGHYQGTCKPHQQIGEAAWTQLQRAMTDPQQRAACLKIPFVRQEASKSPAQP